MATKKKMTKKQRRAKARRIKQIIVIVVVLIMLIAAALVLRGCKQVPQIVRPVVVDEYHELIEQVAEEFELEPAYVASVVMAESSYRTDAVSNVGARGLMQIMPTTGEWIASKFEDEYDDEMLFDPETNLKYGCWYLSFLMRRYDNDMTCASSGYHAGQGTVDGWLADPQYSEDGKTLTNIPGDATRTYVERILAFYEVYKEIYA